MYFLGGILIYFAILAGSAVGEFFLARKSLYLGLILPVVAVVFSFWFSNLFILMLVATLAVLIITQLYYKKKRKEMEKMKLEDIS